MKVRWNFSSLQAGCHDESNEQRGPFSHQTKLSWDTYMSSLAIEWTHLRQCRTKMRKRVIFLNFQSLEFYYNIMYKDIEN